jgi:carboxymethylenebutenolidase
MRDGKRSLYWLECTAFHAHGQAAHKTAEIYVNENAGHAFNNDTRESYRPEAAKLAMQRSLEWFSKYLKS